MRPSTIPARNRRAFIDTSAFYALADARDDNHNAARAIQDLLTTERWRLLTTNFVLAETHALTLSRLGRNVAAQVLRQIDLSPTMVVRATQADEQEARAILSTYDDKNFSLADAISFAIMKRMDINVAFTFDHNFTQYGLTALTPEP